MTRQEAEQILQRTFKVPKFYDEQWQTIEKILKGEKVLLIEKTGKSDDEKLIWLGKNLNNIPGSGILYTGTRVDTEIYSKWFEHLGISSTAYNAGLDAYLIVQFLLSCAMRVLLNAVDKFLEHRCPFNIQVDQLGYVDARLL